MCTDLQGNVEAVAGPALAVVVLMFLSFCVQVHPPLFLFFYAQKLHICSVSFNAYSPTAVYDDAPGHYRTRLS